MKEPFYEPFQQSEILISIKEIIRCQECLSNGYLCWFHTESLKASIISDVQRWIKNKELVSKK